jgi:hypothetical protein
MRRKGLGTLTLMASLGTSLDADWKITTVSKAAGSQSIETEYFQGAWRRTDWSDPNGNHKPVEVVDGGNRRLTVWDLDARQYTVHRFNRTRLAAKSFPPARVIQN